MKDGFNARIQINKSTVKKILPKSTLIKAFQFALFGMTLPRNQTCEQKPLNPFKPYESEDDYLSVIADIQLESHKHALPSDYVLPHETDYMLTEK